MLDVQVEPTGEPVPEETGALDVLRALEDGARVALGRLRAHREMKVVQPGHEREDRARDPRVKISAGVWKYTQSATTSSQRTASATSSPDLLLLHAVGDRADEQRGSRDGNDAEKPLEDAAPSERGRLGPRGELVPRERAGLERAIDTDEFVKP